MQSTVLRNLFIKGAAPLGLSALALAAGLSASAFAGTASVTNGSFESSPLGQITSTTPTSSGWYMSSGAPYSTAGYTWIFSNGPPASNGTFSLYPITPTSAGSQFLGSDGTYEPAAVNQNITGLTVGGTYAVSFMWAGAQQSGFTGATTDMWAVSLGSQTHDTSVITVPSGGFTGWFNTTMLFTATSANETLSFLGISTCLSGGCGPTVSGAPPFVLLDNVSMSAVPEPATWAMMLLGFAGLGFAFRQSRRKVSFA
jgi:PEP-CTERM motif